MEHRTSAVAVIQELSEGVLTLTLSRPDRRNAFTPAMMDEFVAAIDRADADDQVRAVVVTGAGAAFCAGADLGDDAQRERGPEFSMDRDADFGGLGALRLFRCLKPTIAAINGAAVGIGASLTLPMDIRLAVEDARIGFVFTRRGIVPESCSSWFLPRVVGISKAVEWVASGRLVDAEEALEAGLLRSVHSAADLLPAARALALEIAEHTSPVSVALSRQLLWGMLTASHPAVAHEAESRALHARLAGPDVEEGISSFFEKRPAVFPQRVSRDIPSIPGLPYTIGPSGGRPRR